MNANEYQKLADRTKGRQEEVLARINRNGPKAIQLIHSVIGMAGEVGELASAIEKWLWYGQDLDEVNLEEECGDVSWYEAEMLNAIGTSFADVLEKNIEKLRKRFPEKFSEERAKEENRDREGEREILEDDRKIHDPFDFTEKEIDEALEEGWKLEGGVGPFGPWSVRMRGLKRQNHKSVGWMTQWLPITYRGERIIVPHWFRMLREEQAAENTTEQTGAGWAEPPEESMIENGPPESCPHGEDPTECNKCMVDSDFAYDSAREKR